MRRTSRFLFRLEALSLGVIVAVAGLPGTAVAEWQSVPAIRLGTEGNDNPRLGQWVPGTGGGAQNPLLDDRTSTRTLLDARLDIANTGPRGSFSIEPRVTVDAYADEVDDDLERQDAYLTARGLYRGLRTQSRINVALSRESILTSELLGTDFTDTESPVDEPIYTDTGLLVLLDEHRERVAVTPAMEFTLSERGTLAVELSYLDVAYTGPQFVGRTDFDDTGLVLGYNRATSTRAEAAVRVTVSKFRADLTDNDTDTVGIEGAYEVELNQLWSTDVFAGVEKSTFDFRDGPGGARVTGEDTNFTFGVGLNMRSELGTLTFDLGRSVAPNGSGFLSTRNDLRGAYRRQMSPRLRGGLGLTFSQTESLESEFDQRDYARLDLDLEWALSRLWGLSVGFSAIDQDFSTSLAGGRANVLSLGAVYRGLRRPATGPR